MWLLRINAILWATFHYAHLYFKICIPHSQQKKWQEISEVKGEVNFKMAIMVMKRKVWIWFVRVKSLFVWTFQVTAKALHCSHRNIPCHLIFLGLLVSLQPNMNFFPTFKAAVSNLILKNINIYKLISKIYGGWKCQH